ncbi:hypothetical protein INR49_005923 [Caranx melampygus]|nr:hypothetical protein INR49_005923 [Caranx melampygus]
MTRTVNGKWRWEHEPLFGGVLWFCVENMENGRVEPVRGSTVVGFSSVTWSSRRQGAWREEAHLKLNREGNNAKHLDMLLSQKRTGTREFTGPTPHSVAVIAKPPASRPVDHLILERQREDAARDQVLEFTRNQQNYDTKNLWLKKSHGCFLRGAVDREVKAAVSRHESNINERRRRLAELLEAEELQLLQELEEAKETMVERQARMRDRARGLRERRERERQQLVAHKMEQLFIQSCEELRTIQNRRREQQACAERVAQVRSRQEDQQQQREEEQLLEQLWEADRREKEETERQKQLRKRQKNEEGVNILRIQMEEVQERRLRDKELKEEEAQLRAELREDQRRYRQYLSEELQRQKKEEQAVEQLIEEKLKETWTRREEQNRLQREARNRLMDQPEAELRGIPGRPEGPGAAAAAAQV